MEKWSIQDLYDVGDSLKGKKKKDWDNLMAKHPTTSFVVWREVCDRQSEFFTEFAGCACVITVKRGMQETVDACEQFAGGDFEAAGEALNNDKELHRLLQELIDKYAQNHECHLEFDYLVCFCDEHNH